MKQRIVYALIATVIIGRLTLSGTITSNEAWDDQFGVGAPDRFVRTAIFEGTNLYVAGKFTSIGGVPATNVARWNGLKWEALGTGLGTQESLVCALAIWDGVLYAGGTFSNAATNVARNIAKWNRAEWTEVGGGTDFSVFALTVHESALFVGGQFRKAGGVAA